jgi:hypothetical protein
MKPKLLSASLLALAALSVSVFIGHKLGGSRADTRLQPQTLSRQAERIEAKRKLADEKRAQWARGSFLAIGDAGFSNQFRLVLDTKLAAQEMSSLQREGLLSCMRDFFQAYSEGSYEAYWDFKTRGRDYSMSEARISKMVDYHKGKGVEFPETLEGRARKLWELAFLPGGKPANRLAMVDLVTLEARGGLTMLPESGIVKMALRQMNTMVGMSGSYVDYAESPIGILRSHENLRYAVVDMICAGESGSSPFPLFVSFYWSDKEQRWYPWEMVFNSSCDYKALF